MAEAFQCDAEYKSAKDYYSDLQIPLSILQLDSADRAVLRIAGEFLFYRSLKSLQGKLLHKFELLMAVLCCSV